MKYVLVSFPEIQDFIIADKERFDREAIFVNDVKVPESSYMIPVDWYYEVYNNYY